MKHLIKSTIFLMAGLLLLAACKDDEYKFADHGPDVAVVSISDEAYMGGLINFSVNISDRDFDLSTILAQLYFDEDVVSDTTIRTKTEGLYEGTLHVPFLANIPDGTATVVFTGTNVGQGRTVLSPVGVKVTRPTFDHLTLKTAEGMEYTMEMGERHVYSVTSTFDSIVEATIEAPAVEAGCSNLNFGWDGSAIQEGATGNIPFSGGMAGEYTISFNTLTFEGSPFNSPFTINGTDATFEDANTYYAVLDLTQGGTITIDGYAAGFNGWNIDPDWIEEVSDGVYTFLPVSGKYKITVEFDNEFFRFETMKNNTETATLDYSNGTGAIWLIGANVGKPTTANDVNWTTEKGICLPMIESGKYQITLVAGVNILTSSLNFKFYSAKGWDGEFKSTNISTTSDLVYVGDGDTGDDGNIYLKDDVTLELGGVYKFTVDLTGATFSGSGAPTGAVLVVEQVGSQDIETESITVNGTEMEMVTSTEYVGNVTFTKDGKVTITGIDDLSSWYLSPDYLYLNGSDIYFNAVSGTYEVTLHLSDGYAYFVPLDSEGKEATFTDGALYIMGWGVAYPDMGHQVGWDADGALALAQVSDGVYQLTGLAVAETDTTIGGAFRTDYTDMKYYGQRAWGAEAGSINGSTNTVQLTEEAQKWLTVTNDKNMNIANTLTDGATYRLTIDLTKLDENLEIIDFGIIE